MTRRLAAILAADMVGYSRLMAANEAGTLARLKDLRRDIINPGIESAGGEIIKLTGDGLLALFSSVVSAVEAAATLQKALHAAEVEDSEVFGATLPSVGAGAPVRDSSDSKNSDCITSMIAPVTKNTSAKLKTGQWKRP